MHLLLNGRELDAGCRRGVRRCWPPRFRGGLVLRGRLVVCLGHNQDSAGLAVVGTGVRGRNTGRVLGKLRVLRPAPEDLRYPLRRQVPFSSTSWLHHAAAEK